MSEPKLISPMLDNFAMGDPISDRNGVRCCPAMEKGTDNRYIVKIISTPASQTQLDALLLSGAYSDKQSALSYFRALSDGIADEVAILKKLSQLEGFIPFESCQIVPMDDDAGYDVYMLSAYKNTLEQFFRHSSMTHLGALNLGLDLCAALAVCRRSGYLYVDLKPDNIYLTGENTYRIGDIGFLKLDSLKYASLPERYRSQYTAPEIADAFSSLNTTMDVYAAGLILYQAFNDGALPFRDDTAPAEQLPAPAYADYEMAEIILKACAPTPDARWQDPIEMGQALVDYMQRNGAHDTPIVPVLNTEEDVAGEEVPEPKYVAEEADKAFEEAPGDICPDAEDPEPQATKEDTPQEIVEEEISEESIYSEDESGNLTFLADDTEDETAHEQDPSEIDYKEVSEEVSDMLNIADDLIAHHPPDPVVQPEPIDVPIPPPLPVEIPEQEDSEPETAADTEPSSDAPDEGYSEEDTEEDYFDDAPQKPKGHILRNVILVLIAAALITLGFFYYKNYYLQPIESIILEDGDADTLTVLVSSQINEEKLTVICFDTYGNQLSEPVKNGKAVFTNLAPNSAYTIKVDIEGFHRLTGDTYAAFTTPVQTNIVQFRAVTGSEDGSAVIAFTIDGPDAEQWKLGYSSSDEAQQEITFSGHMVTLTGLTLGSEYTFTLSPVDDMLINGTTEIKHIASAIVKPVNLAITGCINNTLTASWSAPEGSSVDSWTVRCYNDDGFDETQVVTETNVAFEGIDMTKAYTVEVAAAGMSVNDRAFAAANSITVTNFSVDDTDPNKLTLTWESVAAPEGGWLLLYTMDGSAAQEIPCQSDNSVTLDTRIPGAKYTFTLQAANGTSVLGGILYYNAPAAQNFSGYGLSTETMTFRMCKTPSWKNWDRYDLSSSDYTAEFEIGQNASFLINSGHQYSTSSDEITILFVIRDENGAIISTSNTTMIWKKMWYRSYCELDIPSIPQTAGKYTVSVYFNGDLANEQSFSIA